MLVTDLGLELSGVEQSKLDAAQVMLNAWEAGDPNPLCAPWMVRHQLRQYCPKQPIAEEIAKAAQRVHQPALLSTDDDHITGTWSSACRACHQLWPCPDATAARRALGMRT